MKFQYTERCARTRGSLPAWGVRVEIRAAPAQFHEKASLPAWGVRVEIKTERMLISDGRVTPRMGSAG